MIKNKIEIHGLNVAVLSVTLRDILEVLKSGIQQPFYWKLLLIEATSNKGFLGSILEYEKKIELAKDGTSYEIEDLMNLSDQLDQIYNLTLIGDPELTNLRRYKEEDLMYESCFITIELIDSSYWEIYCNSESISNLVLEKLPGAKKKEGNI